MGLKSAQLELTKPAIGQIIEGYARESGVRSLENYIKKIMRKVAIQVVKGQEKKKSTFKKVIVKEANLDKFLGKPLFTSDRFYEDMPVGVAMGLAWTALGGATLYIESIAVSSEKREMKLTGQAGDVMQESSQIAWTYLHSRRLKYAPDTAFFEKAKVHLHIPEGATPKDGPSAGVTMVTAMLSLLRDQPILDNLGMSGELTLTGQVLPIGGVKEKLIAARRSGAKVLIFPKGNQRDYDQLPAYLKKGIKVHFVKHYDEVFDVAFS
jgi:ATP-dependent Lon protease